MKKIIINPIQQNNKYPIFIGANILGKLGQYIDLKQYAKIVIITDATVNRHLHKLLPKTLEDAEIILLPTGEDGKTMQSVISICDELLSKKCPRDSLIITMGGGVICDVGGFVASIYMRGIDHINIPTTLLSQVDASIGGKTGINFGAIKNSIGTFKSPKAVIIDTQTLATLPKRLFIEGFGEIIKHGLIADKKYFTMVTSKKPEEFSNQELLAIITRSCEIKASVIQKDLHEKGLRKILNFGHTIGHAIEAASLQTSNPLLHGEAISIGIVAESYISLVLGNISSQDFQTIKQRLQNADLPTYCKDIPQNRILEKLAYDKKQHHSHIQWTLLQGIGKGIIHQDVDEKIVEKALVEVIL